MVFIRPFAYLTLIFPIICWVFSPVKGIFIARAEATPLTQKELKKEIADHKKEYEKLKKKLIQNKKLEKKYMNKQDDLKFRMLELRMDKEKLHMMIEQNHMNEIRFSRMLSQLNRQIHHEKLLLKSHQTSAGIQEETLLHNALTEYLVAKDITSDNPAQMISLWVTNVSLQRMRRKISRDKIQEFSTSMKVDALFRKRDHVLHREELRRREESDEKYQMELIRRQIVSLKARAEGIEKKNKILMTKTENLLGLIRHLRLVERRNRVRYAHHFSPVKLRIRGLLWPVNGKIIEPFGRFHDGIDIAAASGIAVKSAEKGRVLFARHYTGYGKLVIINHGRHVYSLYGHMKTISVKEGQIVRKGQNLGTAGGGGTNGQSTVFFGLTHFGNPVNPIPYLGKREYRE